MKPIKITRKWLEDRNACHEHIRRFVLQFPRGITLGRKLLTDRVITSRFDCSWLARTLINGVDSTNSHRWNEYLELTARARSRYMGCDVDDGWYWSACAEAIADILFPLKK